MIEIVGIDGTRNMGRRHVIALWIVLSAAAASSIFILPRFVPVSPSVSDSFLFGYNNRAGVLMLLGWLVLAGVFSGSLRVKFRPAAPGTQIPNRTVAAWMGVYAVGCTAMWVLVHGLQGFGESEYFIDRVEKLAEGGRIYQDFEFAYGALFLYAPRLIMNLHFSAEQSYFIFWLLCTLVGVWMLARVLEMMDYPTEHRTETFHLLCMFNLLAPMSTGVNYSFLRFLPAPYFGLLVQRMYATDTSRNLAIATLMGIGFTVALLVISPEMAVAFAIGTVGYFAVFSKWDLRRVAACVGLALGELLVLRTANQLNVLVTLKAFSGGAFNFPILPAPHILAFFCACGLVCFFVAARLREGSRGDGLLMVVAVSVVALFAALGRCDPGHVGLAGIGIVVTATLLASGFPRFWRSYRAAFLILFVILPGLSAVWGYRIQLSKVVFMRVFQTESPDSTTRMDALIDHGMQLALGKNKGQIDFDKLKASSTASRDFDLASVHPLNGTLQAPFGFSPFGFGNYHSPHIETGYFDGLTNVLTPGMVQRKLNELQTRPNTPLVLPINFEDACRVDPAADRRLIEGLFLYPYRGRVRHAESVLEPLCDYIDQRYRESSGLVRGYSIWDPH